MKRPPASDSFVSAARELSVTPAAVSQQVRALERCLDRRLFMRLQNRIVLTDAGAALFPGTRESFERLAATTAVLSQEHAPVRLTVSTLNVTGVLCGSTVIGKKAWRGLDGNNEHQNTSGKRQHKKRFRR